MAHFILEYSTNLDQTDESIHQLFTALHQVAEQTGVFPMKGLRGRAYPCDQYRMADGNPEHGFAHLTVKLGAGRSMQDRESAAKEFFAIMSEHFAEQVNKKGVMLSFEMKELEAVLKFNQNNVPDYL